MSVFLKELFEGLAQMEGSLTQPCPLRHPHQAGLCRGSFTVTAVAAFRQAAVCNEMPFWRQREDAPLPVDTEFWSAVAVAQPHQEPLRQCPLPPCIPTPRLQAHGVSAHFGKTYTAGLDHVCLLIRMLTLLCR